MKFISGLIFLFSFLFLIQSDAIAFTYSDSGFISPLRSRGFALVPAPQEVRLKPQNIIVDGSWSVLARAGAQGMLLKRLTTGALELHNLSFSAKGQKNIVLELRPGIVKGSPDTALNAQGYLLNIAPGEIRISGNSQAGLFYGVQSLLQLLRADDKGRMIVPEGEIRDWPSTELRFAHWDTKHHQDRIETLKRYLDQSAFFKINAIAFEIYDKYEFPRHPLIGAPGAFTKVEIQELTAYAKERFIQLVPDVQAPSHFSYALKHEKYAHLRAAEDNNYQACMCDPEAIELIFDIYQDMIDATPGVDYFLVSTDEVYYSGICDKCPRPYNEVNRSLAWAEFAAKAHDWLAKRGRRMIAWVEYPLLKEHIALLPAGIIDGAFGSAAFSNREWITLEKKAGISQLAYSSMQGGESLFPDYFSGDFRKGLGNQGRLKTASEMTLNGLKLNPDLKGVFGAAWDDAGLHNETFWLGWVTVAQYGWNIGKPSVEQHTADFMDVFYGYSSTELTEIYRLVQEGARFYERLWDMPISKEGKKAWGNSNGKGIGGERRDKLLAPPALPKPGNLSILPEFRKRYADKIETATGIAKDNERLISLILNNITRVKRNQYNLEVALSLAYLEQYTIQTVLDLAKIEDYLLEAANEEARPMRAMNALIRSRQLAEKIIEDRDAMWKKFKAVWEKSQFPRNRTVNGKAFVNIMPDVNGGGDINRFTGLEYMIAPFERIGLKKWRDGINEVIRDFAKRHNLDAEEKDLD